MPQEPIPQKASPSGAAANVEGDQILLRAPRGHHSGWHLTPTAFGGPCSEAIQAVKATAPQATTELSPLATKTEPTSDGLETSQGRSGYDVEVGAVPQRQPTLVVKCDSTPHEQAPHRCACSSRGSRRNSNSRRGSPLYFAAEGVRDPSHHRLFCAAGVHALPPKDLPARKRSPSNRVSDKHQEEQRRPHQQSCEDAACDAQAEGDGKLGARCKLCGTLRANAPGGFSFSRGDLPFTNFSRKSTSSEAPEGGGVPGPLGRLPSCDECGCLLLSATQRSLGPYHLLKQHQQPTEVVAGGVQWGPPTSFWLVESEREEGVVREFRRLFKINSPVSIKLRKL